jgi:site-specific DNA recombinase
MRAASYLRSSKDRTDVSIAAQRRELEQLAAARGLQLVAEYTDAVESAKDEDRPGFQKLLIDLRSPSRGWTVLLMVDTSRLSRRRFSAQVFKHEAAKRGVQIIYSKVPDADPITNVLIQSVLEAFDEIHSLMSKEKGLAGMRENVARGFRAGGRAPLGYRLEHTATGVMREGKAVMKSRLVPGENADQLRRYLQERARGTPRTRARELAQLDVATTTLIGIEYNALTYAGHTVWNVHNEHGPGGYKGNTKRRPRAEWVIQRDTHTGLVSEPEAEAVLTAIETSPRGATRRRESDSLLTGLLKTPDGTPWHAAGNGRYRIRRAGCNSTVGADELESAVLEQVRTDLQSEAFITALTAAARQQHSKGTRDPARELRKELTNISDRIQATLSLAPRLEDPAPALREVDRLERERRRLSAEIDRLARERAASAVLASITEDAVRDVIEELRADLAGDDRARMKDRLGELCEKVELEPDTFRCQIHYRIAAKGWHKLASPRGFEPRLPP